MQNKTLSLKSRMGTVGRLALITGMATAAVTLTGCGVTSADLAAPIKVAGTALQGAVHGGQQPVSGATIQLYAVNNSGYGAASYALLTTATTTSANGTFGITGAYTCPSPSTMIYITATGGNPGLSGNNPNSAMMAALGACKDLSSGSFIAINELTTVASVYALAPFMTSYAAIGSSTGNVQGLTNAFATVNKLANVGLGTVPGPALPAFATAPVETINTLADIIASCINSTGGTPGDGTNCGKLFTYTTVAGVAPTDTIGALLNIAHNPGQNAANLLTLSSPTAPFQPTMAGLTDFTLTVKHKSASNSTATRTPFSGAAASAIDASGNIWVANATTNAIAVLAPSGVPVAGSPFTSGALSTPSAIAIDAGGNAWITDKGTSKLTVYTPAFNGSQTSVATLSEPTSIAIDGQGILWITNIGSSSVTAVNVTGTTVNSTSNYSTGGVNAPVGVAISSR